MALALLIVILHEATSQGLRPGPKIELFLARDPDNKDAIFSDGDELLLVFDEDTNSPPVSHDDLMSWLDFSHPLGILQGVWLEAFLLKLTILSTNGYSTPPIGNVTVSVVAQLRNQNESSAVSTSISPRLSGSWGSLAGPVIIALTARDPDNQDASFSAFDIIDIAFSAATNTPFVGTPAAVKSFLTFSSPLPSDLNATWLTPSVLRLTMLNTSGTPTPTIGHWHVAITGTTLRNMAGTSLPSVGMSPVLGGDWGTPACSQRTCDECIAATDCGWCESNQTCSVGNATGPLFSTCDATGWYASACPACSEHSTCGPCLAEPNCGWCASPFQEACRVGSSAGPFAGTCDGDRLWRSMYCQRPVLSSPQPVLNLSEADLVTQHPFNVSLSAQPMQPVRVVFRLTEPEEAFLVPWDYAAFTDTNWDLPQEFSLIARDDLVHDGDVSFHVTATAESSDPAFEGSPARALAVVNHDNDVPSMLASVSTTVLYEDGGSLRVFVSLTSIPTAPVTVPLSSLDPSQGVIDATLSFNAVTWNMVQSRLLVSQQDAVQDGNASFTVMCGPTVSSDPDYDALLVYLNVTSVDDDVAGLVVHVPLPAASSRWTVSEDPTVPAVPLQVSLGTQPEGNVTVPVSVHSAEGVVDTGALLFSPETWDTPLTAHVRGVHDFVADGLQDFAVTIGPCVSALDVVYNGSFTRDVPFECEDVDVAGIAVSLSGEVGNGTSWMAVALRSKPTSPVYVTFYASPPGAVHPSVLVFLPTNWSSQRVLLEVIAGCQDGSSNFSVHFNEAVSLDVIYATMLPPPVTVSVLPGAPTPAPPAPPPVSTCECPQVSLLVGSPPVEDSCPVSFLLCLGTWEASLLFCVIIIVFLLAAAAIGLVCLQRNNARVRGDGKEEDRAACAPPCSPPAPHSPPGEDVQVTDVEVELAEVAEATPPIVAAAAEVADSPEASQGSAVEEDGDASHDDASGASDDGKGIVRPKAMIVNRTLMLEAARAAMDTPAQYSRAVARLTMNTLELELQEARVELSKQGWPSVLDEDIAQEWEALLIAQANHQTQRASLQTVIRSLEVELKRERQTNSMSPKTQLASPTTTPNAGPKSFPLPLFSPIANVSPDYGR